MTVGCASRISRRALHRRGARHGASDQSPRRRWAPRAGELRAKCRCSARSATVPFERGHDRAERQPPALARAPRPARAPRNPGLSASMRGPNVKLLARAQRHILFACARRHPSHARRHLSRMSGSGLARVDTLPECRPPGSPRRRVYRMLTLVSSLFLCRSMRPWQSVPRARSAAHGLPGSQGHGTLTSSGYGLNARLTGQHRARDTTLTRLAELQATSTSGSDRARSG